MLDYDDDTFDNVIDWNSYGHNDDVIKGGKNDGKHQRRPFTGH